MRPVDDRDTSAHPSPLGATVVVLVQFRSVRVAQRAGAGSREVIED
ncbi:MULTISPECIES: hypothetical protein [unclassified Streptomyces]|nr:MULTISPECIES: hypothetical protein [unclassified Streptomyces]MDQ0693767.1 hypothetical protein [Streptomyces sp. W4I9-2]MDX3484996.1 hypothetical protein [Streptomyces sp. ID05-18]